MNLHNTNKDDFLKITKDDLVTITDVVSYLDKQNQFFPKLKNMGGTVKKFSDVESVKSQFSAADVVMVGNNKVKTISVIMQRGESMAIENIKIDVTGSKKTEVVKEDVA